MNWYSGIQSTWFPKYTDIPFRLLLGMSYCPEQGKQSLISYEWESLEAVWICLKYFYLPMYKQNIRGVKQIFLQAADLLPPSHPQRMTEWYTAQSDRSQLHFPTPAAKLPLSLSLSLHPVLKTTIVAKLPILEIFISRQVRFFCVKSLILPIGFGKSHQSSERSLGGTASETPWTVGLQKLSCFRFHPGRLGLLPFSFSMFSCKCCPWSKSTESSIVHVSFTCCRASQLWL